MEPIKNVPPAFIVESCMLLDSDLNSGQIQILPDMLRRVRLGEAEEKDLKQLVVYAAAATGITERRLLAAMKQHPSSVAFLMLCWCMIRQSKWNTLSHMRMNDLSYISYPHLRFGMPVSPPPNLRLTSSLATTNSTLHLEVLAMQYRSLVQSLYKYKQMDMSRVNLMNDIIGMVQDIFRNDSESSTSKIGNSTTTSNRDKTVANPYTISLSSMNRLLENLWHSVELIDPTSSLSATHTTPKDAKSNTKATKPHRLSSVSGIETLRVEVDALKEVYASAEQGTSSEVSFLKWASGGITPQYAFNTIVPTSTNNNDTNHTSTTSRPTTASNTLPPSPLPHTLPPPTPNKPTNEDETLGKFVLDSTNMMGELEEYMLELLDSGGLLYEDLCEISVGVDKSLAGVGLTVEEIDAYCNQHSTSASRGDGSADSTESSDASNPGNANSVSSVNLFDYIDSAAQLSTSESSDILYRHIQQQYVVPVVSSQTELSNLRQLHEYTMRRTANACAKYSPFEIVWRNDKSISSTQLKAGIK